MKIAISANGPTLDAEASQIFGRSAAHVFVDTDTMTWEALDNAAIGAAGGAGIQSAQFVVQQGVQAVVSGNVGPNAFQVFRAAGIPVYQHRGGTVRQVVAAFKAGQLSSLGGANVPSHIGLSMRQAATPRPNRESEIAKLQEQARELRQQLAQIMEQIDKLEQES